MNQNITYPGLVAAACSGLMACSATDAVETDEFSPVYNGVETIALGDGLVDFWVNMTGARDNKDVAAYGKCVAVQYALTHGAKYARHVRTNITKEGGIWRGDAVYSISSTLPEGLRIIDAELAVQECAEQNIPTV